MKEKHDMQLPQNQSHPEDSKRSLSAKIVVLIVAGIFSVLWIITATWGVFDLNEMRQDYLHYNDQYMFNKHADLTAVFPFLIKYTGGAYNGYGGQQNFRSYYFWFFGYKTQVSEH